VVGTVYGNLPEKLLVLRCISYPFPLSNFTGYTFFILELLNYPVSRASLCSVLVFLNGRGVQYCTLRYQLVGCRNCFFSLFFFFLSFDRGPGKSADVGLGGLA